MLKLMKYEFRRQLFSKFIIFGSLLLLVAAFFGFYWKGMETGVMLVVPLMTMETIIVMFYAPLEYLLTFDKDMNTKQGYMLLLVPKKSTTILGAKMLVSVLQNVVIYTIFFTVVPFCERLCEDKFGFAPDYIGEMVNGFFAEQPGVAEMAGFWITILLLWMFFSGLGLFVSAIPGQGKAASVIGLAMYILAVFLVFFVMVRVEELFYVLKVPELAGDIFEVYMLGIDIALFFGTARLLDKKVSI